MKILSYLNISNVNDIECDSGYIFNYTLYNSFVKDKIDFKVILPEELKEQKIRFLNKDVFFTNMGKTKYKTRYFFPWDEMYRIILDFAPDVIFINQCELTSSIKALLIENNLSKIKLVTYCHYPALHINEVGNSVIDYTLNDSNIGQSIVYNILSAINIADVFVIQSSFAKTMLLNFANFHNFILSKDIFVFPPPYDANIIKDDIEPVKTDKILYNHRLYESYGASKFVDFVQANPDLNFIVTDPMCHRDDLRKKFNSSPEKNREILKKQNNVKLCNGNIRSQYIKLIDKSRLAIAPFRTACVWSMSIIDCYCRGIPVIGPNIAAFPELIPSFLLYSSPLEERALIERLLYDDNFWIESVYECRKILKEVEPNNIVKKILALL